MKNSYNIYYFVIVFLIIMIFVPPFLRMVWSDEISSTKDNNQNMQQTIISNNLSCEFINSIADKQISIRTTTKYYDNNVTYIEFRYDLSAIKNTELMENSVFKEISKIKTISGAIYNSEGNEEVIYFSNDIFNNQNLKQYSQEINVQKLYYETLGFTCNIANN